MGMALVAAVGRQSEESGPAAADPVDQAVGHQGVQDTIDRYPVDRLTVLKRVIDLLGV